MADLDWLNDGVERAISRLVCCLDCFFCHTWSLRSMVDAMLEHRIHHHQQQGCLHSSLQPLRTWICLAIGSNDIFECVKNGIIADQRCHLRAIQFRTHVVVNF